MADRETGAKRHLGRGELVDIAKAARAAYEEELRLFGLETGNAWLITGGIVRAVVEALDAAGYLVMLKRDARLMYDVPTDGVGEHVRFETVTPDGHKAHILGDPNMSDEQKRALGAIADAVAERHKDPEPPTDDRAPNKYPLDANAPDLTRTPLPPTDDSERAFFGGPLPASAELDGWGDPAPFPAPAPEPRKTIREAVQEGAAAFRDAARALGASAPKIDVPLAPEIADPPHENALEATDPSREEPAPEIADTAPDYDPHPTWTEAQHKVYHRAAMLLKRLAREGYMPTMAQYNEQRGDLPNHQDLLNKLGCTWRELATWLGLQLQSRHRGPGKGKAAAQDAADEDAAPEAPAVPRRVANPHQTEPLPDTPPKAAPVGSREWEVQRNADNRAVRPVGSYHDGGKVLIQSAERPRGVKVG